MHRLCYDDFNRVSKDKCSLLYRDTDSLYLNIEKLDLHSDLTTYFSEVTDFSNFSKDHNSSHQCELGFLKFETIDPVRVFNRFEDKN